MSGSRSERAKNSPRMLLVNQGRRAEKDGSLDRRLLIWLLDRERVVEVRIERWAGVRRGREVRIDIMRRDW